MKLPGTKSKKLFKKFDALVSNGVGRIAPFFVQSGKGSYLKDVDGNRYLDFSSGISATNLGHSPPSILKAIQKASKKFLHTCFLVAPYENYLTLAEELHRITPGKFPKKTFLATTGAEAVENAIKIARKYTGRTEIISFKQGFHGRTLLALSLIAKEKPYKEGFGPFLPGIHQFEYPDRDESTNALFQKLKKINPKKVAAVIIEPIAGEGGFLIAQDHALKGLQKFCRKNRIVFIVDEVQTGFCRTGKWFASEWSGITPDLIVLAKSIASGLPLSAVVGKKEIMDSVQRNGIGGTFNGNPICVEVAIATIKEMKRLNLEKRSIKMGKIMEHAFQEIARKSPFVKEARGLGMMHALELDTSDRTKNLIKMMAEHGLLALPCGFHSNVIRFLPSLTISKKEFQKSLKIIKNTLMNFLTAEGV